MLITGASLLWHNLWLIPVCFLNWLLMTLVLKHIEEKWLLRLYGQAYADYMKRVNRAIPWKRRTTK
jgi:protein-S-isoprenylcysteine O-methyltransferase Ste14